ncbi:MAG: SixA phosphatase family protein [Elusimicrobiota bacterium]
MELLIVRHGPAGDRDEWRASGRPDEERPLTKDGRRKTRAAARGLVELLDGVDLVATSPWARAVQTAELIAEAFGGVEELKRPELIPDRAPAELLAWLKTRRERRIVLVGHEPHLSRFASWLLTGREKSVLNLKKSQAFLLTLKSLAPGEATLLWSAPPRALRGLSQP